MRGRTPPPVQRPAPAVLTRHAARAAAATADAAEAASGDAKPDPGSRPASPAVASNAPSCVKSQFRGVIRSKVRWRASRHCSHSDLHPVNVAVEQRRCGLCGESTIKHDDFLDLSLTIPGSPLTRTVDVTSDGLKRSRAAGAAVPTNVKRQRTPDGAVKSPPKPCGAAVSTVDECAAAGNESESVEIGLEGECHGCHVRGCSMLSCRGFRQIACVNSRPLSNWTPLNGLIANHVRRSQPQLGS